VRLLSEPPPAGALTLVRHTALARGRVSLRLTVFAGDQGNKDYRFPIVNVFLIVANFAVWIIYELPQLNMAVYHASFHPCTVEDAFGSLLYLVFYFAGGLPP